MSFGPFPSGIGQHFTLPEEYFFDPELFEEMSTVCLNSTHPDNNSSTDNLPPSQNIEYSHSNSNRQQQQHLQPPAPTPPPHYSLVIEIDSILNSDVVDDINPRENQLHETLIYQTNTVNTQFTYANLSFHKDSGAYEIKLLKQKVVVSNKKKNICYLFLFEIKMYNFCFRLMEYAILCRKFLE